MAGRRLRPDDRRETLLVSGAALFATRSFDAVLMEDVADHAGVSRTILYRHFATKRDLFAAVYQRAADRLLVMTTLDGDTPLDAQILAGLDAHIDYFVENRQAVLTANRVLAGDPVIQAIISDELAVLRQRLIDVVVVEDDLREAVSTVIMSWLVFVRTLCVDWLVRPAMTRSELRDVCSGALLGGLAALGSQDRT